MSLRDKGVETTPTEGQLYQLLTDFGNIRSANEALGRHLAEMGLLRFAVEFLDGEAGFAELRTIIEEELPFAAERREAFKASLREKTISEIKPEEDVVLESLTPINAQGCTR